jgi:hypothetical protein
MASQKFTVDDGIFDLIADKGPELWYYAFRMHHKSVSREKADRILFDDLGGMPDGMAERLGMLYAAPLEALANKENKAKNSKMTVEF